MSEPTNLKCFFVAPDVSSGGIWNNQENPVLSHSLPLLQLQMFLLFAVSEALHFIFRNLGFQKLVAQILAGLIMGPEIFGNVSDVWTVIFPTESSQISMALGLFGYVLFLFTIGVKIDISMAFKAGKITFLFGILAVLIPFSVGVLSYHLLAKYFSLSDQEIKNLTFLTSVMAITQFTDVIMILEDLKIINSELGRLCLSSAMVSGAFGMSIAYISIVNKMCKEISVVTGIASGFLVVALGTFLKVVVRPAMFWVIKQTPEGRPVQGVYIYTILAVALAAGSITAKLGHFTHLGAFLVGLVVPDGPPLGSALINRLDGFLTGVLLPFFVSATMLSVRLEPVAGNVMASSIITCLVIWGAKLITCLVPPLYSKMPINDAFVIALILSTNGIAEIAFYSMVKDSKTMQTETFAVIPFFALFTSTVTSLLVKCLYDPSRKYANYQRRNIMHTQNTSHLKLLTCVYKSDDSYNIIDFLNASNPTLDNPISVDVLHLIELVGRASPIFVSHQLQTKAISKQSYSEKVINSFTDFATMNLDSMFINFFTAISPLKLMHEDICTLALNKESAFILLPFHRKWAVDGSIELEDDSKRILNCSVLEKAPCSVGILIDCNKNNNYLSKASRNVCMIFIGGNDDREALTLAKRTITNPVINLTVLRLVVNNNCCRLDWSEMLDLEELKEVKQKSNAGNEQVKYIEEVVFDGGHTSKIVQSIVSSYDVIIVGRRHDIDTPQLLGLMEWSEFPELGAIGDLVVASRDAKMKALVLVVQQQLVS